MQRRKVVVFDLDDTLYKEIEYLKSAYREISSYLEDHFGLSGVYDRLFQYWENGDNAFAAIIRDYHLSLRLEELLKMYRGHRPQISLDEETHSVLNSLRKECILGIITDGRSLTQRNKIKALGLYSYIEDPNIYISEETGFSKPSQEPFLSFMEGYPESEYYYIGDNPVKDFVAPNRLGWVTACLLDSGENVHGQNGNISQDYKAKFEINSLSEIFMLFR